MNEKNEKLKIGSILEKFGIVIILVAICIVLSFLTPSFLKVKNFMNVMRQVSITGIIAVGMIFVIATGGIDLSVGSIVGVVSMVAASLAHPGEHPLIVTILAGLFVGTLVGLLNGVIVAYGEVPPFIATLGTMTSLRGVAMIYNNGRPIIDLSEEYTRIGGGMVGAVPVPVIIFVIFILIGAVALHYTRFGRHVFAVGGNELSAKVSGINVKLIKLSVYMITGFASALTGIVISSRVMSGSPVAGEGYEMDAITACVIGGASLSGGEGGVISTIIGALIVGVVNNGLDLMHVKSYWQSVVKGIIVVGAVLIDIKTSKMKNKA